jgi:transposase
MDTLPELERLSAQEKDALMVALWAEVQPLHPHPDQVIIAKAKVCPHCGDGVSEAGPSLQAVYDKIEVPPVKPIVTRVERYGGRCAGCGQPYVAPVPTGMEPGTPFGASVQRLATYLRYTPAIRDERLSALLAQVCGLDSSEGGLANLFQGVKGRLDHRVAEILTRLRSSRVIGSDATSARVNGQPPWEGVCQNAEGCVQVIRPSRGQGVIQEVLGAHRPTLWVSDRSSAQQKHPAEDWQVCLAPQVRDCPFALEAGDVVCAPRMKAVCLRACAIHTRRETLAAATLSPVPVRFQAPCRPRFSQPAPQPPRLPAAETLCQDPGPLVPLAGRCHHSTHP